ncbi:MAG TPA: 4'-phosphopantetheinyl transferase superfamily protein [Acidobacteriota bacterium]|nr:4'-phosphopantetheinyl transferase superfamily protein [Acidobacteriota bacterium]
MLAIGNDIIDLHDSSILEHTAQDEEWMRRHLTESEWLRLDGISDEQLRLLTFWKRFALKEASSKAMTQLGHTVPFGSFTHFEVDVDQNQVLHCSGEVCFIHQIQATADWIHAVVSSKSAPDSKIVSEVHDATKSLPQRLLEALRLYGCLDSTFIQKDGIPQIVRKGEVFPVSFSHSGRFAAFCWLIKMKDEK